MTLKPEHGVSVKSIYEGKDVFRLVWQVTVDLHAIGLTLRSSRLLILDTRLCFTDVGLAMRHGWNLADTTALHKRQVEREITAYREQASFLVNCNESYS